MTTAELKRHMDRRFDRLERTKADKRDLRRFATKKDLRRFTTKTEMRLWSVDIKRYFDVVAEGLEEKLQKVADGVSQIADSPNSVRRVLSPSRASDQVPRQLASNTQDRIVMR